MRRLQGPHKICIAYRSFHLCYAQAPANLTQGPVSVPDTPHTHRAINICIAPDISNSEMLIATRTEQLAFRQHHHLAEPYAATL